MGQTPPLSTEQQSKSIITALPSMHFWVLLVLAGTTSAAPWPSFQLCTPGRCVRRTADPSQRLLTAPMLDRDGSMLLSAAELENSSGQQRYALARRPKGSTAPPVPAGYREAATLHRQALELLRTRPAEARRLLQQALVVRPGHTSSLIDLGVLEEEGGRSTVAARLFEKAVGINPREPLARVNLGATYTTLREWNRAAEQLRTALGQLADGHPLQSECRNRLGVALLKGAWATNYLPMAHEAFEVFSEAAALHPLAADLQMNAMEAAGLVGYKREAVRAGWRLMKATPDRERTNILSRMAHAMREAVEWRGMRNVDAELRQILSAQLDGNPSTADLGVVPLHSLALGLPVVVHRRLAEVESEKERIELSGWLASAPLEGVARRPARRGLRVLYWSSEIRLHPVHPHTTTLHPHTRIGCI